MKSITSDPTDDDKLDVDYCDRRVGLAGHVFPLLISLNAGEGLRDASLRACHFNGHKSSTVVGELSAARTFRHLSAFISIADFAEVRRVCDVLGVRRDDANLRQLLSAGVVGGREFVSFFGQQIRRAHINHRRRVSPRSLRKNNYQKAVWSIRPVTFDPDTMEMLMERCPACSQFFGWEMSRGVNFCDACGMVDLRDFPQPFVQSNDESALKSVCSLIDPESMAQSTGPFQNSPLGKEKKEDLFQLAVRIAAGCSQNERGGRVSGEIEPKYLEVAGHAMLDWPQGFLDLVDATVSPSGKGKLGWFDNKPLRRLQFDPTLTASIRGRIKSVLEDGRRAEVFVRTQGTQSANLTHFSSKDHRLSHPRAALLRLIADRGEMPNNVGWDTSPDPSITAFRDIEQARSLSKSLGISLPEVWHLCCESSGLCTEDSRFAFNSLDIYEIGRLYHKSVAAAVRPGMGDGAVSLASSRFALDPWLTASWSNVFEAILGGTLHAWRRSDSTGALTADLYVNDFHHLKSVLRSNKLSARVLNSPISQSEVSMIINKTRKVASDLVRSCLIAGVASIHKLGRMRQDWAFGFELKTLAQISQSSVGNLHRKLCEAGVGRMRFGDVTVWRKDEAFKLLALPF